MAGNEPPIVSLDEYDEPVNLLVYGDSGVGKTVFAGTAPKALFLSTETGTISAKRQGSTAKLWRCLDWEALLAAYDWLRRNPDHGYDWVILDSLTEMQQHLRTWILQAVVKENPNRDPDIFAIQDYQKWYLVYKKMVRAFCNLPVNTIFTALARRTEDAEAEPLVLPSIEGKDYELSQWTCSQMMVIGYLGVKKKGDEEVRRIVWQTTPPYFAKDRYDALGKWTDNSSMTEVARMISGEVPPLTRLRPARPAKAAGAGS